MASGALQLSLISEEEYLAGEEASEVKHEYIAGRVYAMVGARFAHNAIAGNVLVELGMQLRDKPCHVLPSDNKVRIRLPSHTRFYYPDVTVVCGENVRSGVFQDRPSVIVEVLSRSTRRIDDGEKREAYLTIPTLATYILVEQEMVGATVYQRDGSDFRRHVFTSLSDVIPLSEIACQLALENVYAKVPLQPEAELD